MKSLYLINSLITGFLMASSAGQAFPDDLYCPKMSKDPRCWERPSSSFPATCKDLRFCTRITAISMDSQGRYICQGSGSFNCDAVVAKYGTQTVGFPVLVTYQQVDTCHMPRACGDRACRPFVSIGYATLDPLCR